MSGNIKVGMAQLAPVWLDSAATLEKVKAAMQEGPKHKPIYWFLGKAFFRAILFGWP